MTALWHLDETSGNRQDSASANHLTENNAIASAAGKVGNAANFDASQNEILSVPSNADLQTGDVTFYAAMWVKADVLGTNRWIMSKWTNSGNREFILRFNAAANRFEWIWYTSTAPTDVRIFANTLGAPAVNTWYFIEVWRDAITDTMGIAVNRGAGDTATVTTGVTSTKALELGGDSDAAGQTWDGLIDEVRYYKGSIPSVAERDAFYAGGGWLMALTTDLYRAYREMNEASGTRNDSHGANHLTDNNTVGSAPGIVGTAADFEAGSLEYLSIVPMPVVDGQP